jgi:hypothetical protein
MPRIPKGFTTNRAPIRGYTRWKGVLNNYTEDQVTQLEDFFEIACVYACYGREIAPSTNTPHLQIYMIFPRAHTVQWITRSCGIDLYLRPCYSTEQSNPDFEFIDNSNRGYVKKFDSKDTSFATEQRFKEFGQFPWQLFDEIFDPLL